MERYDPELRVMDYNSPTTLTGSDNRNDLVALKDVTSSNKAEDYVICRIRANPGITHCHVISD